jgi:hypothetical protein
MAPGGAPIEPGRGVVGIGTMGSAPGQGVAGTEDFRGSPRLTTAVTEECTAPAGTPGGPTGTPTTPGRGVVGSCTNGKLPGRGVAGTEAFIAVSDGVWRMMARLRLMEVPAAESVRRNFAFHQNTCKIRLAP